MKTIKLLSAAILVMTARAGFAAGNEALRAVSWQAALALDGGKSAEVRVPEPAAPVPGSGERLLSGDRRDPGVIKVLIKSDGKLAAAGGASFQATKDSFLCKKFSWNEGSATMVPKLIYPEFKPQKDRLVIPGAIDSTCDYKRVGGGSLSFSIPGKAEPYNSVLLLPGGGGPAEQQILCETILMPTPSGKKNMISCSGSIELDADNAATVRVVSK